jgi:hypothetical protein
MTARDIYDIHRQDSRCQIVKRALGGIDNPHPIDGMQVCILAAGGGVNDLAGFVGEMAKCYNAIYYKRCFISLYDPAGRIETKIYDIRAPDDRRLSDIGYTVFSNQKENDELFMLSDGTMIMISEDKGNPTMPMNGSTIVMTRVSASGCKLSSLPVYEIRWHDDFRCFLIDDDVFIFLVKHIDCTVLVMKIIVGGGEPRQLTAFKLTPKFIEGPIIQCLDGQFMFVDVEGRLARIYDLAQNKLLEHSQELDISLGRGELLTSVCRRVSNTDVVLFTTHEYDTRKTIYINLFDMSTRTWRYLDLIKDRTIIGCMSW